MARAGTFDKDFVLGILDTYHDFCKGERTTKAVREARATASDEGDEDGDPRRVEIMRTYLPELLKTLYGESKVGKTYQENIIKITNKEVKSVSTVEHSAVELFEKYFEDQLKANPDTQEFLTFEEIITAYKNAPDKSNIPLWKKYKDGIHNHVLELSKSGRRFGKGKTSEREEKEELEALASFVTNYFFFEENPPGGVYMTFDAGERVVGDIFHDKQNVKCVIFPETLADSATTSLGMLGGRSEYVFPTQDKTEVDRFESNLFSKESPDAKYDIYFENKGFSDQNPYGFNLVIKKSDTLKLSLPFSPKQTEGPSVNYLIDILETAKNNAKAVKDRKPTERKQYGYILKKGTILSVGEALDKDKVFREDFENTIGERTNGLLPDLKRGGDHEAVLASKKAVNLIVDGKRKYEKFVFCTIDILCALKSRLEGLNTIWQGKDKIILYRFPTVLPEEVEKSVFIEKGKETYALYNKLQIFLNKKLSDELTAQQENFLEGLEGFVDYSDRDKVHSTTNGYCEFALNAMLRIMMYDLGVFIDKLLDEKVNFSKLKGISYDDLETNLNFYKKFYEINFKDLTPEQLNQNMKKVGDSYTYKIESEERDLGNDNTVVKTQYEDITNFVRNRINLDINKITLQEGKIVMDYVIQQPVVSDTKKFNMKEHSVFRFNPAVFEKLYDCLLFVHDLTDKNEKRASRDYNKIINKILTGDITAPYNYFALVEDVVNQFNSQEFKDAIREILDFRKDIPQNATIKTAGGLRTTQLTKDQIEQVRREYLLGKKDDLSNKGDYQYKNNGVINNLINYYQALLNGGYFTAPLKYEDYTAPVGGVQTGGVQTGGVQSNALQFYELNDLLFKISSIAASFIESVYSQQYPMYASYTHFALFLKEYYSKKTWTANDSLHFKNKLLSITKDINSIYLDEEKREGPIKMFLGTLKITVTSWQSQINVILARIAGINERKESFLNAINEIKVAYSKVLKTDANQTIQYPTIKEFLQIVFSDAYLIVDEENPQYNTDHTLRESLPLVSSIYSDIGMIWQAGLFEIRQNKEYMYDYTQTDDILSYLLTLRLKTVLDRIEEDDDNNDDNNNDYNEEDEDEDFASIIRKSGRIESIKNFNKRQQVLSTLGDQLSFFDSSQNKKQTVASQTIRGKIDAFNSTIEIGLTRENNISVSTTILFVLTLIENIMNKNKESFFLSGRYTNQTFQAKAEWNAKLDPLLNILFFLLNNAFQNNLSKINLNREAQQLGGALTTNKTRKVKRRASKNKTLKH